MNGIPWWYFYKEGGPHDGHRLDRIDPGGAVWQAVGPQRAIGGVIYSACTVIEPGVIQVANANNRLPIGEPDGAVTPRAQAIAAALQAGGMSSAALADIRSELWAKLLLNLGTNPMAVLAQAPGSALYVEEACADGLRLVVAEAAAIATAMGCTVKPDPEAQIASSLKLDHTPSIVPGPAARPPDGGGGDFCCSTRTRPTGGGADPDARPAGRVGQGQGADSRALSIAQRGDWPASPTGLRRPERCPLAQAVRT